jgi:hypothetical protein
MLSHALKAIQRAAGTITVSFVASATGGASASRATTTSVTIPATTQTNDIIFLFAEIGDSATATAPTITTPTGYTLINSAAGTNIAAADSDRSSLFYKVAVSGDAGSTLTVTHASGDYRSLIIAVFRTTKGSAPTVTNSSINSYGVVTASGTAANPSNQTVTSSSGAVPLIVFGAYVNTATRTFSPTQDAELTNASVSGRVLRYKIYNASPANVTVGATTTSTAVVLQSFYMALS